MRPIAEGKMGPVAVISIPPRSFDNLVSGSRMAVASTFTGFCEHAFLGPMISFSIPYVFDHQVTVEVIDISRFVDAGVQLGSLEEAFSFGVCQSHNNRDTMYKAGTDEFESEGIKKYWMSPFVKKGEDSRRLWRYREQHGLIPCCPIYRQSWQDIRRSPSMDDVNFM